MRILLILLATLFWSIGSWWWYTCKIKGFCTGGDTATSTTTTAMTETPTTTLAPTSTDTDNDGLSDELETKLGLDPSSNDSDHDGLHDAIEVGNNPEQAIDSDNDGIINALDNDDDNDTITTQNEQADNNGDGNPSDAVDTDGDGTPNYLDTDSDGDGLPDADEIRLDLNPLVVDTDGDGIDDKTEVGSNTNTAIDSDGDGTIDALDTDSGPAASAANPTQNNLITADEASTPNETSFDSSADTQNADSAQTKESANTETSKPTNETNPKNTDQVSVDTGNTQSSTTSGDITPANIYFPFRSADPQLSGKAKTYFDSVVSALKANTELKIMLIGHTDNIGSDSDNQKLGLRRAQIIKQTLIDQGAPAEQIQTSSQGESNPIATNETQEGRDQNRRVELLPQ